jgi:hypothetical protein
VASVVGFGGMCGALGGMFMQLIAGGLVQWLGSFTPTFIIAGILHPIAWVTIRLLTGPTIQRVDVDRGLRTAKSPRLLIAGAAIAVLGAAGALVAWAEWDAIVTATKSTATAAGGVAASSLVVLIGLAMAYASREQRVAAAA